MSMGPSSTAAVIAACRLADLPIGSDSFDARHARAALAQCGLRGHALRALADTRTGRVAAGALERALLPGIRAHYRWRRARVAQHVEVALARGASQIVELGPGFDPALARLAAAHRGVRCVAIDHAATLGAARAALHDTGLLPPNLGFVARDLSVLEPWSDVLDPALPTLVIAIGVAMYLPSRRVLAHLAALRARLEAPLELIGSVMARNAGRPRFERQSRWVDRWLAHAGEPFAWGVDPERLATQLARIGWLGGALDVDGDPCPGEHLVAARAVPQCVRAIRSFA